MTIRAAAPHELGWLRIRSGWVPTEAARGIVAVTGEDIQGMVVLDEWTPNSARIHVAIERPWLCRGLTEAAFAYPFLEAGKGLLLATIPADNQRCLALVKRLGFVETHRVVDGWACGVALVMMEMRKETCRYLRHQQRAA